MRLPWTRRAPDAGAEHARRDLFENRVQIAPDKVHMDYERGFDNRALINYAETFPEEAINPVTRAFDALKPIVERMGGTIRMEAGEPGEIRIFYRLEADPGLVLAGIVTEYIAQLAAHWPIDHIERICQKTIALLRQNGPPIPARVIQMQAEETGAAGGQ